MDRRTFLKTSFAGTVLATTVPATWLAGCTTEVSTSQTPPLRLSFQENTAPGETLTERLDFMEAHGVVGLEPSGRGLGDRLNELQQALRGTEYSDQCDLCRILGIYFSRRPDGACHI